MPVCKTIWRLPTNSPLYVSTRPGSWSLVMSHPQQLGGTDLTVRRDADVALLVVVLTVTIHLRLVLVRTLHDVAQLDRKAGPHLRGGALHIRHAIDRDAVGM